MLQPAQQGSDDDDLSCSCRYGQRLPYGPPAAAQSRWGQFLDARNGPRSTLQRPENYFFLKFHAGLHVLSWATGR
jgi:hypothetical protein